MKRISLFLIVLASIFSAGAQEVSNRQINQNAIALTQAFLNLPDEYIGGVSMEDRREVSQPRIPLRRH